MSESNYFVGLMSGTSLDGVDAVLVSFSANRPRLVGRYFRPLPEDLAARLRRLSLEAQVDLQELGATDAEFGELLAECALAVLGDAGIAPQQVRAIGSHGITVRHIPNRQPAFTLQLGDANRIAERTGITTVADFRRRDMAAGGQGAPLVPAFHQALFYSVSESRAVLNIGGIANLTVLPHFAGQAVTGFDTGPGNTLLDYWAQRHLNQPLDREGQWAAGGRCCTELLQTLLSEPYLQKVPPKSTGKELFSPTWLHAQVDGRTLSPQDIQATLAEFTAETVTRALQRYAPRTHRLLVCGGGVHNTHLMDLLQVKLDYPVESTAAYGVEPDWLEAMAFAWLARQTLLHLPGNLPAVTGARQPVVLGAVYAGQLENNFAE